MLHTGKIAVSVILRRIKARHIQAFNLRQIKQQFFFAKALSPAFITASSKSLITSSPSPITKNIGNFCQWFRVKGCTRPADNNQRFFIAAVCRTQFYIAHLQHGKQICIVHFKGHHYADNFENRQAAAEFPYSLTAFWFFYIRPAFCRLAEKSVHRPYHRGR